MKTLSVMAFLLAGLVLTACTPPDEETAMTKQNDVAIVDGLCTDLTVTTLNKVHTAKIEEAAPACHELQNLLKGRTCENEKEIYPEAEHLTKCDLAMKAEKAMPETNVLVSAPPEDGNKSGDAPKDLKACAKETTGAVEDLKKMKIALEKKKTATASRAALKLCGSLQANLQSEPCAVQDSKTKEVRPLTLKEVGLSKFCQSLVKH